MAAKRDEYVEKLKSQLDKWNAEMAKWEAQSGTTQEKMRAEYDKQAASGDAWTELARGADESWARMRIAIEKASTHFKK